ncbi:MAG: hypothetical protein A2252_07415 [Elusimicrobia bacterium RIFOXYA2_FULL_39_19]|nr:MAG: hypothetical protein A2252_07415 [Elusimicrobia bacterium RIFOXYA2_FULL_39_19]
MNTAKRGIKNFVYLISSNILTVSISILSANLLGRYLSIESFGSYSYALAFASILMGFTDLGIKNMVLREISKDKTQTKNYYVFTILFKLVLYVIVFVATLAVMYLSLYSIDLKYAIVLVLVVNAIGGISRIFQVVLRAYERFEYESIIGVSGSILNVGLLWILLHSGYDYFGAILSILITTSFEFIAIYYFFRSIIKQNTAGTYFKIDIPFAKEYIKKSLPFILWSILGILYFKIDTIILQYLKGLEAVGIYSASRRIIEALIFIPASLSGVFFPVLSRKYKESQEEFKEIYMKGLKIAFIIGLPSSIALFLLSEKIIPLIWTAKYVGSIDSMRILGIFYVFCFLQSITSTALTAMNKQNMVTFYAFIGFLISITANIVLIPKYSASGASIATLITEAGIFLLGIIYISKKLLLKIPLLFFIKVIISAVIMGLVMRLLINQNLLVLIIVGIITYLLLINGLKIVTEEEKRIIRSIFIKKPA